MESFRWAMHPLQSFRYVTERLLIVGAAKHLPLSAAMLLADLAGLIDCLIPSATWRTTRAELRAATGEAGWRGLVLLQQRLAMPRRELVFLTRMRVGRERLEDWLVLEEHYERVERLISSGSSMVLATAHFSSAAVAVAQKVLPATAAFLIGEAASKATTPGERRRQLADRSRDGGRIGLLRDSHGAGRLFINVPDLWGPDPDWGDPVARVASVRAMVRRLREPSGIVVIMIDAIWGGRSDMVRPFAAQSSRRFAVGAAAVARVAQCPIVPFAVVMEGRRRTVRVLWGTPIPSPPRNAPQSDLVVLYQALTHLECAIANYPTQYLAPIGTERRWHAPWGAWV